MHTADTTAFAGIGFLATGAIFSISDVALSRTSFELMAGPMLWIVGCALMVAWAIGRVGLAPTVEKEPSVKLPAQPSSKAAAAGSGTKTGKIAAEFLAPLAIWLMLLSFLAVIVLLLGYGSG
jgi:hypothetical protein